MSPGAMPQKCEYGEDGLGTSGPGGKVPEGSQLCSRGGKELHGACGWGGSSRYHGIQLTLCTCPLAPED